MDTSSENYSVAHYDELLTQQSARVQSSVSELALNLLAGDDGRLPFKTQHGLLHSLFDWLSPGDANVAERRVQALETFPVPVFYLFQNPDVRSAIDAGQPLIPVITDVLDDYVIRFDRHSITPAAVNRLRTQRNMHGFSLPVDHHDQDNLPIRAYAESIALLSRSTSIDCFPKTQEQWIAYYELHKHCVDRRQTLTSLSLDAADVIRRSASNWTKASNRLKTISLDSIEQAYPFFIAIDIALPFVFQRYAHEILRGGAHNELKIWRSNLLIHDSVNALNRCFKELGVDIWKRYEYNIRASLNYPKIASGLHAYDQKYPVPSVIEDWPSFFSTPTRMGGIEIVPLNSRKLLREEGEAQEFCVAISIPDCILGMYAFYGLRDAYSGARLSTVRVTPNTNAHCNLARQNTLPDEACLEVGKRIATATSTDRGFAAYGKTSSSHVFEQVYGFHPGDTRRAQMAFEAFKGFHALPCTDGIDDSRTWLDHIGFRQRFSLTLPGAAIQPANQPPMFLFAHPDTMLARVIKNVAHPPFFPVVPR